MILSLDGRSVFLYDYCDERYVVFWFHDLC